MNWSPVGQYLPMFSFQRNPSLFTLGGYYFRCIIDTQKLLFYSLCCNPWISSFESFPFFLFSHPIPDFYADIPALYANITALYAKIPWYLVFYVQYRARCAIGGGGGVPWVVWRCPWPRTLFNQAGGLTCQPNSRFRASFRIPFPQGTGGFSSVDHSWVRPCNDDLDSTVYPPPYLWQGFRHFCCHDSTQLQEYYRSFPP